MKRGGFRRGGGGGNGPQLPIEFDAKRSAIERDRAITRVDRNADEQWRDDALEAVRKVARTNFDFIADAVWSALAGVTDYEPHEARAMGAVLRRAAAVGICRTTSETRPSARIVAHRRPMRVWRSRIYR